VKIAILKNEVTNTSNLEVTDNNVASNAKNLRFIDISFQN